MSSESVTSVRSEDARGPRARARRFINFSAAEPPSPPAPRSARRLSARALNKLSRVSGTQLYCIFSDAACRSTEESGESDHAQLYPLPDWRAAVRAQLHPPRAGAAYALVAARHGEV